MSNLMGNFLRWLLKKLGLLLLIVAILVVVSALAGEWNRREQARLEIETQASAAAALRSAIVRLDEDIADRERDWATQREALRVELERGLAGLDARIEQAEREWSEALVRFADVEQRAREARREAEAARARWQALERAAAWWDWLIAREKIVERERARAMFLGLDGVARTWEAARDRLAPRFERSPADELRSERERRSRAIAEQLATPPAELQALLDDRAAKQREAQALEDLVGAQRDRLAREPGERLRSAVARQLPAALWILAAALAAPVLAKAFLYFVFAPLAERLPPIRIRPDEPAPPLPASMPSSVSLAVDVGPDEELLVHPDFIQSSSRPARKQTQWFLNARLPLSSLAAGLFALTRIRAEGSEPTRVVVSSQRDPFGEVGLIALPAGAAMVVQPRSLAGVAKPIGIPVDITRHWRLFSPHAWLTLQLRYLVFHGPCRLVLKGCRGVRAEQPEHGRPRLINQWATLAFSANLEYRNTRCETFVSYMRGREALFNDLFAGGPGCFVYEEMPAPGYGAGRGGRGLAGLSDAVLKALGI